MHLLFMHLFIYAFIYLFLEIFQCSPPYFTIRIAAFYNDNSVYLFRCLINARIELGSKHIEENLPNPRLIPGF